LFSHETPESRIVHHSLSIVLFIFSRQLGARIHIAAVRAIAIDAVGSKFIWGLLSMRKSILVTAALFSLSGSALAADLPNLKGPPAFTPPPVFSWTGVYIGGQIGIQWGQTGWARFDPTNTTLIVSEPGYANNGVVGGGHIGYNYQISQFVLGLEGDVEDTNYNGNGLSNGNAWANTTRADIEASVRARVGVAWNQLLVYVTGGGAYTDLRNSAQNPPGTFYAGDDDGRFGWTAGAGVEYAIDPNWSIRAEYRFTDFGQDTLYTGTEVIHEDDLSDHRFEAGFSYKFDMFEPPAPIVAKY
jgi:outer membrane immunogenic protein